MGIGKEKNRTADELRRQAEEQLDAKIPGLFVPRSDDETRKLLHELEVHQIELEMQNAELRQDREEVEKTLDRYTDLYDFSPVGYFTLDRDGTITAANLTGAALLGIARPMLLGRRFGLYVSAEYKLHFSEFLVKVFASQSKESCELELVTKGDSPLIVQIEAIVLSVEQECRVAVIDITERKRLEKLTGHLASFPQLNPNPVLEVDSSGRVIFFNPAAVKILDTLGMADADMAVFLPADMQGILGDWDRLSEVNLYREVFVKDRCFGQTIFMTPAFNVARIYAYDITDRKRIEEQLRDNERQLADAQRITSIGSWQWNPIADRITGSEEFCRIFAAGIGSFEDFIARVHPDDRDRVNHAVQDSMEQHTPGDIYYRIVLPDETIRMIHAKGAGVYDSAGKLLWINGTVQDVTERRRTEDALSEKRQELEELNRSLEMRIEQAVEELRQKDRMMILQERLALMGEMINNIAHQWRQPLNILGMVIQQLPLFYDSAEFNREFLEKSTDKSMNLIQHMSRTIDDFSNFFRSDKEATIFGVSQVIGHALSLIEQSFKEQQINIDIHTEGCPLVSGYPNEYAQALLNILLNARDALVEQNVEDARISLRAFAEKGKTVVTVADNAGGIAEEIIDRLFDPYFTTKSPDKGTGIGLYMAKTIIERNMGGRLTASNGQDGALFRIEVENAGT